MELELKDKCVGVIWKGHPDCQSCQLQNQVLFADLPFPALQSIFSEIDTYCYSKQKFIYQAEHEGRMLYTIRKGLVKLYQLLPNGQQRIVRLLKQGEVAGMEVLIDGKYHHFAETIVQTDLCQIPVSVLKKLQDAYPVIYKALLKRWQENIDEADKFITLFSTGTSQVRMARLLLYLHQDKEHLWNQVLFREDMGDILGISKETASRVMADFKRKRIISIYLNHISILDPVKLQSIADK